MIAPGSFEHLHLLAGQADVTNFRMALLQAKEQGVDMNTRFGRSLLQEAALWNRFENIRELLEGAWKELGHHLINAVDNNGNTALQYACCIGREESALELLKQSGKRIGFTAIFEKNNLGRTALHYDCSDKVVKAMLQRAEEINSEDGRHNLLCAQDDDGNTVFHSGSPEKHLALLQHCTVDEIRSVLCMRNLDGRYPLHYGLIRPTIIRAILSLDHDHPRPWLNETDIFGQTPLQTAISSCRFRFHDCVGGRVSAMLFPMRIFQERGAISGDDDDIDQEMEKERWIVGGVDPNTGCSKRTSFR